MVRLSHREVEVLSLAAEGLSNKGIGSLLHISDQTVKNYLSQIFIKLGANDRTHAVVLAHRLRFLDLDKILVG